MQDQAEAALARERAECEAKVQAAEARLKTVEEQNKLLHDQLTASAGSQEAGKGASQTLKVLAHGVDSMSRDVCRVQALSQGAAMMIRVSRLEQRGECFRLVILRIK